MIAAIIAVLAVVAIIVYATVNARRVVPSAAVAPNPVPSLPAPALVGSKARSFTIQTPQGPLSSTSLSAKPYLLEIFATWCPHCQRETAVLRRLRAAVPESRLTMVSVTGSPFGNKTVDGQPAPESQADVDQFNSQYRVTWTSVFDPNLTVAKAWGFAGFPEIFVVDRHGKIAFVHNGEIPEKELLAAVHQALSS